jgi:MFS family permease
MVSLMQSLVIPIVPELSQLLGAPASDAAWAVTAMLLATSVATRVVGRLGDMTSKRCVSVMSGSGPRPHSAPPPSRHQPPTNGLGG